MERIRIAFVKYAGLTAGGSEKLIQIIAGNLPKEKFDVTYFYCDPAPTIGPKIITLPTDQTRIDYLRNKGVSIVKFSVAAQDLTDINLRWCKTDFWELFHEEEFDLIQTSRSGHPEYPFNLIKKTPIVDLINLDAGVDNQFNIARVLHICRWRCDRWVAQGGDRSRTKIVSLPIDLGDQSQIKDLRRDLNISDSFFVFGFHQRPDDNIFSEIPLAAYKKIESSNNIFLMLGGSKMYQAQAKALGIKNIIFLPATGDINYVYRFLKTLNVFAHGRKDGEVNSQAMAEALYYGVPVVSHYSKVNNGHIECLGDAGTILDNIDDYAKELKKMEEDSSYYMDKSQKAIIRFKENYELTGQMKKYVSIYEEVFQNPFPHKLHRWLSSWHWTQNIRQIAKAIYYFFKFDKYKRIFDI